MIYYLNMYQIYLRLYTYFLIGISQNLASILELNLRKIINRTQSGIWY